MGASLSPMMTHYVEVKEQNSRGLLFYRVGDFYELFFDDARRAAELLDLTCTSRQNHGGEPIPMAGVPHHALQTYVDRCLAQGVSAVICDQLEDAALAKGMVKRGVTRIETPARWFKRINRTKSFSQRLHRQSAQKIDGASPYWI